MNANLYGLTRTTRATPEDTYRKQIITIINEYRRGLTTEEEAYERILMVNAEFFRA